MSAVVKMWDDKKEKHQSYEAKIIDGNQTLVEAYGRDTEDAIENLKDEVRQEVDDLKARIKVLENIDYSNPIWVRGYDKWYE
jgi:hypothetical protein